MTCSVEHCKRQKPGEKSITVAVDGDVTDPADVPRDLGNSSSGLVQSIFVSSSSIWVFCLVLLCHDGLGLLL